MHPNQRGSYQENHDAPVLDVAAMFAILPGGERLLRQVQP
jgi:hypothetical protein